MNDIFKTAGRLKETLLENITKLTKELEDSPDSVKLLSRRAYLLLRLVDLQMRMEKHKEAEATVFKALKDFEKLAQMKAEPFDTNINIGLLKEKLANIKFDTEKPEQGCDLLRECIKYHDKAVALKQSDPSAYLIRGNVKQSLAYNERNRNRIAVAAKLSAAGIADYDKAIELGENSAYASRAAARVLVAMSPVKGEELTQRIAELKKAVDDYDTAIIEEVDKPKLFYLRGEAKAMLSELYEKQGNMLESTLLAQGAMKDYEHELSDDPRFLHALSSLVKSSYRYARSQLSQKNFAKATSVTHMALKRAEEALNVSPNDESTYYDLARLHFLAATLAERKGNLEDACKHLESSVDNWDILLEYCSDDEEFQSERQETAEILAEGRKLLKKNSGSSKGKLGNAMRSKLSGRKQKPKPTLPH